MVKGVGFTLEATNATGGMHIDFFKDCDTVA